MILNSSDETVEFFSFKIKTALNIELHKNFEWIYFHGSKNKTIFTEKNSRRFASKLRNSQKLIYTKN